MLLTVESCLLPCGMSQLNTRIQMLTQMLQQFERVYRSGSDCSRLERCLESRESTAFNIFCKDTLLLRIVKRLLLFRVR